jgi:hypothetical protein
VETKAESSYDDDEWFASVSVVGFLFYNSDKSQPRVVILVLIK